MNGTSPATSSLTDGRRLSRNVVWNIFGYVIPPVVMVLVVPRLLAGLGPERFGILTLAWVVIGYIGVFDLGLGRALTQLVAEKLGAGAMQEVRPLVWTALAIMVGLGCVGACVGVAVSPWLVEQVLNVPPALVPETTRAFWLLALSAPLVIVTSGCRGVLEAMQRFAIINLVRIPAAALMFAAPLAVLAFSTDLVLIVAALVATRLLILIVHLVLVLKDVPMPRRLALDWRTTWPLLRTSGWMTLSNVLSPLLANVDRFVLGAAVSIAVAGYYSTAYEAVTKLWLVPTALSTVLFPAFSATAKADATRAARLFLNGTRYTFLVLVPPVLAVIAVCPEVLGLWLGAEAAAEAGRAAQWLTIGVFASSLGSLSFALVQATGRADLTAKLHLLELPFYMGALWLLTSRYGAVGAAIAWTGRMLIDSMCLWWLSTRQFAVRSVAVPAFKQPVIAAGAVLTFALLSMVPDIRQRLVALAVLLPVFLIATWWMLLNDDERALARRLLPSRPLPSRN